MSSPEYPPITWPEGKRFAFAFFDDTDLGTVANVGPVYELLAECGIRSTKSVWPTASTREPVNGGETCEDPHHREWLLGLQADGFEIGYHLDTAHTAFRDETIAGLERFREIFGDYPRIGANHTGCRNCIYWGDARLHGVNRLIYNLATRFKNHNRFFGEVEGDPTFWGDVCRERITYMRSFVYPEINTLKACPMMPYHDPDTPYVNLWYASSEGSNRDSFVETLSEANQDRLEEEGGACIMYTHFGFGFHDGRQVDPRFAQLMKRLGQKDAWFTTTSRLLDFLVEQGRGQTIARRDRQRLERTWLSQKLRNGTS